MTLRFQRDDGTYTVSVGDFYAEEERDVVVEVTLAEQTARSAFDSVPHLVASLAYTNILSKVPIRGEFVVGSISRLVSSDHVSRGHSHVLVQ